MDSNNEKEVTIIYALVVLLAAMVIIVVLMPTWDAQVTEINAADEFYRKCMAKEDERVIVESHAGNWSCNERHTIIKYGMAR